MLLPLTFELSHKCVLQRKITDPQLNFFFLFHPVSRVINVCIKVISPEQIEEIPYHFNIVRDKVVCLVSGGCPTRK